MKCIVWPELGGELRGEAWFPEMTQQLLRRVPGRAAS
jgi:hypothetical protein